MDSIVGVLGGMGPQASAHFLRRLTELTPATVEQDHVPVAMVSDPRVPDRVGAVLSGTESPVPAMLAGVRRLEAAGAGCIAIACNTAYCFVEELEAASALPFLHIVDACARDLADAGIHGGPVGILGTAGTLESGLYQDRLAAKGYDSLVPTADEMDRLVKPGIALVKQNRADEAQAPLLDAITLLAERGAQAAVLACTEIPVAMAAKPVDPALPPIDSIDALARACLRWWQAETGKAAAD